MSISTFSCRANQWRNSTCEMTGQAKARTSRHGVTNMVLVAMCDENGVDPLGLELGRGADRVQGQERMDVQPFFPPGVSSGTQRGRAMWMFVGTVRA